MTEWINCGIVRVESYMVMRINEQILLKEAEESRGHIMKGDTGENLFLETLKNLK